MDGKRPRTERTQCVVVDNGRRGIDGCGSGTADGRRPRGVPILESVLLEPNVIDIMNKQIKINLDEAKSRAIFKESFQRFDEKMKEGKVKEIPFLSAADLKDREHTPAERKFINKMCVYVCVIAALVVFAGYALTPINWDILITK